MIIYNTKEKLMGQNIIKFLIQYYGTDTVTRTR